MCACIKRQLQKYGGIIGQIQKGGQGCWAPVTISNEVGLAWPIHARGALKILAPIYGFEFMFRSMVEFWAHNGCKGVAILIKSGTISIDAVNSTYYESLLGFCTKW